MSQMVTRKGPVGDDKEKGHSDSPVKEMKKKMAANAEKEKNAAEKSSEKDKAKDKSEEKQPEKVEKPADKKEKAEKSTDKKEKNVEKEKEKDKAVERKTETPVEKPKAPAEKPKAPAEKPKAPAEKPKEDKNAKPEKQDDKGKEKDKKPPNPTSTPAPSKQNGARTTANGLPSAQNGSHSDATVSSDDEMVIDHERDDMFPELAYEDSDGEFEPPTPEGLPSRSYTRRDQAKATRTPETPRPASERRADASDDSKESKVLKLKEDTPSTDRKLRSSDSPKPESKKVEKGPEKKSEKEKEIAKDAEPTKTDSVQKKNDLEVPDTKDDQSADKSNVEVIIDVDVDEEGKGAERSKADTNYSRSRVKVSPYRRAKVADQTTSSVMANYTGNNTTMEMDITETSSLLVEEPSVESPYLSGLRSIRGRRSYKPLKEMSLRNVSSNRSLRSAASLTVSEQPSRPTAPVVGRKRRPEGDGAELDAPETLQAPGVPGVLAARGKRARLLDKLARPFRSVASTPLPSRRNAEIVGINTDLPLTAPVASPDTFDPETLKQASAPLAAPPPHPATLTPPPEHERDSKRCIVM